MDDSSLRTLWCGNLSSEVSDEILYDLFLQAGPLEKVSIPKERDGRHKGYAFVTFKHECSVPYTKELMKGITLFGRMINLQNRTGARVDNVYNDSPNPLHQRSMSLEERVIPHPGLSQNFDASSFNALLGFAGLLSGNPMMQCLMPPPQHQNHQRSRSYGDRYYDGNNRDERRDFYNSADRQRSRDNSHRGRPRNDGYDRFRESSYRDRDRGRDRHGDRDRSRSNNRPHDNRHRSRM